MNWQETLVPALARLATSDGRHDCPMPGLYVFRATEPTSFVKHATLGATLTVVAQGAKIGRFRNAELRYDEAHCLLVAGGTPFEAAVVEAGAERPYLALGYELPGDVVLETLLELDLLEPPVLQRQAEAVSVEASEALIGNVLRLIGCWDDPVEQAVLLPLFRKELVLRLLRSPAAGLLRAPHTRSPENRRLGEALSFIGSNLHRPLTVEEIAGAVSMSPSHFAHRFRAMVLTSPMQYHKQLRLMDARRRLLAQRPRVSELADAVGYGSVPHFVRDFRKQFGLPPSEYLERLESEALGRRNRQ